MGSAVYAGGTGIGALTRDTSFVDHGQLRNDVELSVVMPCLNEAKTVVPCVAKARAAIHRMSVSGEVIVSDNGSVDGSVELAESAGARVVFSRPQGYGCALHAGILSARGRYVIIGDADGSYDLAYLEPFLQKLRRGYDLVMGNRFRGGIKAGAMPWLHRYFGNWLLTGLLNLLYRSSIYDAHCGLRGFRREAYGQWQIVSQGMEFASEVIIKALLNRHIITEIPVVLYVDGRGRRSHLRSFRDGYRHLRLLVLLSPLARYFQLAGAPRRM